MAPSLHLRVLLGKPSKSRGLGTCQVKMASLTPIHLAGLELSRESDLCLNLKVVEKSSRRNSLLTAVFSQNPLKLALLRQKDISVS